MNSLEILRLELIKARLEYERLRAIWANPYSSYEDQISMHKAWGRWSGIAKAMEVLGA